MEEKKTFNKKFLFIIVGVLLICAIGVSFAYFAPGDGAYGAGAGASGDPIDLIKVTYDAGTSALTTTNLTPGNSTSKAFTVKVEPTSDENTTTYAIYLDITSNTFAYCDSTNYDSVTNPCTEGASELSYNLKGSDGSIIATGDITAKTGKITLATETKTVDTATTYNYTLEIVFNDTNTSQNHNSNKSISGNVLVEFVE